MTTHPLARSAAFLLAGLWLSIAATRAAGLHSPASQPPASPPAAASLFPSKLVDPAFLEQFAATRGFSHGTPKSITLTPAGDAVLFLRSGPRSFVQDLFAFDLSTGQERVLLTAEQLLSGKEEQLTPEELARRERMRMASRGIAGYSVSGDGALILVPLSGQLFVVERATGKITRLNPLEGEKAGFPIDARFSPDGKKIACVRSGDLYVTDIAANAEARLTRSASDTVSNALAEFVAQEEMDRFAGYWWSPDSAFIAYQQTDTGGMETFHIADAVDPARPPQTWPYPRPGKANAAVKLGIIPSGGGRGGETTWVAWDSTRHPYLARVTWPKNAPLTILVQNREQTEQTLFEVAPTGAVKPLLTETDSAWLNLVPSNPRWLRDGSGFLWMTENDGSWRLALHNRDGALIRTITPPNVGLDGLIGVDEKSGDLYVSASDDPTQSHLWRVPSDPALGAPQRVTSEPGRHAMIRAKDSAACVISSTLKSGELRWTVHKAAGEPASGSLRSTRETPPWTTNLELTRVGPKGMHAALIRPRGFDKGRKYPVIVNVYGGPHANTVHSTPSSYFLQQWIADQGFVVVTLDGRGTPGRGRAWERAIRNDLIGPALDDQAEGLAALGARFPELDLTRVGIYGWSFGGYFSAMAVMRRGDVYHAGVAGAPVCDWLDYDTHYTERYLGVPSTPEGLEIYRKSSVLTYCPDLTRPLMIVHGTSDDNVYFMHSLKMTQSLFRAGKPFEFLPLAGFTHMVPDPVVTTRLYSRIAQFFQEKLAPPR